VATFDLPILNGFTLPDTNGNTYWEPASVNFGANDLVPHMILAFTSQSAREGIGGKFRVPQNYVGTPILVIEWASTPTTGDVVWDFEHTSISGDGTETADPAAHDRTTETVTDTVGGTARFKMRTTITLVAGDYAANDEVLYEFYRDAADAADTLAASGWLFNLIFRFNDV